MSKAASLPRAGRESVSQVTARSTMSKSRAEKSRAVTVAALPQVSADIVPGRFTESDWVSLLHAEDGEEEVGDVTDSLLTRVMDECFAVYLTRQVIPFAVSQARQAMVETAGWTSVPRDGGEERLESDASWREEEEPGPPATDSWAQGCVPVTCATSRPTRYPAATEIPEEDVAAAESLTSSQGSGAREDGAPAAREDGAPAGREDGAPAAREDGAPSGREGGAPSGRDGGAPAAREGGAPAASEDKKGVSRGASPVQTPQVALLPAPPAQPPRRPYRPHRGPLRSAPVKEITKSLEETEKEMFLERLLREQREGNEDTSVAPLPTGPLPTALYNLLKIQLGRPPQKRDVVYDTAGNVVSMPRLSPSRLPRNLVRPGAEVLEAPKEANGRKVSPTPGARTSVSLKHGRRPLDGADHRPPDSEKPLVGGQTFQTSANSVADERPGAPAPLSAGILLESMQLSHGVILREGSSTDRGSLRMARQPGCAGMERALHPMRASVALPPISVEQLIKNQVPRVHPARRSTAAPAR